MNYIFGLVQTVYTKYVFPWLFTKKDPLLLEFITALPYKPEPRGSILDAVVILVGEMQNMQNMHAAQYIKKKYINLCNVIVLAEHNLKNEEMVAELFTANSNVLLLTPNEWYDIEKVNDAIMNKMPAHNVIIIKMDEEKKLVYERKDADSYLRRKGTIEYEELYEGIDTIMKGLR